MIPFLEVDPMKWLAAHNMDHEVGLLGLTKYTFNLWVAAGILVFLLWRSRKTSMVPDGKLRGIFEMFYFFIRDELVYPTMGAHHGRTFMPFFLTLFSLIFVTNLVGLIPLPKIGGAATSSLGMTIPLAVAVFLVSVGAGIKYNGIGGFLKGFAPSGVPAPILLLLFPIELVGFLIKHSVLAVRLFANMLAGHLVIAGFLGLIFVYKSYAAAFVSIPLCLFMNLLELLVAFLQAYVFTLLSVLFIGGTVHPDH